MANREIPQQNQQIPHELSKRRVKQNLVIVVFVGMFLGFLSPWGMGQVPLIWSVIYWVVTCACGYAIYMPSVFWGNKCLLRFLSVHWIRVAISTLFASVLMSFVVPVIGWMIFNMPIDYSVQFWQVLPKAIVIGGVLTFISMVQDYIKAQNDKLEATHQLNQDIEQQLATREDKLAEKLLEQLPLEKRGQLLCLEMSDHYLKVYTDKGHHLLLMRFKDALDMLQNYPGLRTHRSWWVANDAVVKSVKDGRKLALVLQNDVVVPVSKTYLDDVKAAKLF